MNKINVDISIKKNKDVQKILEKYRKTKPVPAKFQTKPPFEKGSDQEEMEEWEMKGPQKEKT